MQSAICKYCSTLKVKEFVEERPHYDNYTYKIYKDQTGRKWRGLMCPDCAYANKYKPGKYQFNKQIKDNNTKPAKTVYKCKFCHQKLGNGRRYYHDSCLDNYQYRGAVNIDGDFLYMGDELCQD